MPYIHCLNNISSKGTDLLGADYELTDEFSQATGVLVRSAAMHDLCFPPSLLAIARAGAGVNNIPLDRCAEEGIVVFNTPGANANAVKELVIAGMLLASRDIIGGVRWCRDHAEDATIAKDAEKAKKAFAGREVKGKKLGVIGLGAIGAEIANVATHLGMDVYGYDPYISVKTAWRIYSSVHHLYRIEDVFRTCDYVTIHVPATPDTKGMITAELLSLAPEGAVLLNFSRDTLVDTTSLTEALAEGRLARYVTDFATPEVMKMERAIVLPHLGASTNEAEDNCAVMAVQELTDYLENGNIVNSVNYPECDLGIIKEHRTRVVVLHENIPNMISQISTLFGRDNINIIKMYNRAKDNNACTLLDLDTQPTDAMVADLETIDTVRRVRVLPSPIQA